LERKCLKEILLEKMEETGDKSLAVKKKRNNLEALNEK
jgi:hypothetical protein